MRVLFNYSVQIWVFIGSIYLAIMPFGLVVDFSYFGFTFMTKSGLMTRRYDFSGLGPRFHTQWSRICLEHQKHTLDRLAINPILKSKEIWVSRKMMIHLKNNCRSRFCYVINQGFKFLRNLKGKFRISFNHLYILKQGDDLAVGNFYASCVLSSILILLIYTMYIHVTCIGGVGIKLERYIPRVSVQKHCAIFMLFYMLYRVLLRCAFDLQYLNLYYVLVEKETQKTTCCIEFFSFYSAGFGG